MKDRTIAGLALFLLPSLFLTALMWGESMAPGYSIRDNAISDLGVINETAALFTLTLGAVGVLSIIGGYFLYREDGRKGRFLLYVLAGVGAIGAGAISLNDPSGLHGLFALLAFLFFSLLPLAAVREVQGPLRAIAAVAGILGIIFLVAMFVSDAGLIDLFGPIGHGGLERMIAYPPMIWLFAYGSMLMSTSRTDNAEAPDA